MRTIPMGAVSRALVSVFSMCTLTLPALKADTTYTFRTINDNGDPNFNQLLGINNTGTIAGYFGDGNVLPNKGFTVVPPYSQPSFTDENFPNSVQTQVVGINNTSNPTTVGFWIDNDGNNFGFVKQGTSFTPVANPLAAASAETGLFTNQLLGVNNNGLAAGFYTDANANAHGYTYNIGTQVFTAIDLPTSFNAASVTATDVNNSGVISGFYTDNDGNVHGFIDNNGKFSSYDDPNGNLTNTMFLGLNNNNQIVGSFVDANGTTNGLLFNLQTSTWQTVDDPNQSATAAFMVTGTTLNGINDEGQLVGFYSDGTHVNGLLATATPEPASLGLMAIAMMGIGLGWRKRGK